jgi:hypothetical protein
MINSLRPISQNLDDIPISDGNLSVSEIKNLINKDSPLFHNRTGECYARELQQSGLPQLVLPQVL